MIDFVWLLNPHSLGLTFTTCLLNLFYCLFAPSVAILLKRGANTPSRLPCAGLAYCTAEQLKPNTQQTDSRQTEEGGGGNCKGCSILAILESTPILIPYVGN